MAQLPQIPEGFEAGHLTETSRIYNFGRTTPVSQLLQEGRLRYAVVWLGNDGYRMRLRHSLEDAVDFARHQASQQFSNIHITLQALGNGVNNGVWARLAK